MTPVAGIGKARPLAERRRARRAGPALLSSDAWGMLAEFRDAQGGGYALLREARRERELRGVQRIA